MQCEVRCAFYQGEQMEKGVCCKQQLNGLFNTITTDTDKLDERHLEAVDVIEKSLLCEEVLARIKEWIDLDKTHTVIHRMCAYQKGCGCLKSGMDVCPHATV